MGVIFGQHVEMNQARGVVTVVQVQVLVQGGVGGGDWDFCDSPLRSNSWVSLLCLKLQIPSTTGVFTVLEEALGRGRSGTQTTSPQS